MSSIAGRRGAGTDYILSLVQDALDGFDDRSVEATVRKTIRIANLLGDSKLAVRLGLELKPMGGDAAANAEDTKRLLAEPDTWGDPEGAAERAVSEYIADRTFVEMPGRANQLTAKVLAHSLGEIEFWDTEFSTLVRRDDEPDHSLPMRMASHQALSRARHRCFAALCQWERQLTYSNTNARIFSRFESDVDVLLSLGAPAVVQQFNAVHRRLREAAVSDPDSDASEELSQSLMTCRRILETVVDHVYPADQPVMLPDGTEADPSQYRARLRAFIDSVVTSGSFGTLLDSEVGGLYARFRAVDKLSSRAVHARVALDEAETCAILTYVLAGELIRLSGVS